MRNVLFPLCAILSMFIVFTGCASALAIGQDASSLPAERVEALHALAVQFTDCLNTGDTSAAMAMLDDATTTELDGKLAETWTQITGSAGAFVETGAYVGMTTGEYEALEMTLVFEYATVVQRVVFDSEHQITGLRYRNGKVEDAAVANVLPDGITETAVTVDAGEGYPLDGMLTMPKGSAPTAAIVLVHGSGPSDMDEAVGANAPFRDLAYGLAQKGIAVLRYDKRTYTHAATIVENGGTVTIDEEVAADALAAVKLLKSWEGIDEGKIYLLGHSMGGGLLSYVNSLGADCAGYIIIAGIPRNLWELSAEQNLLIAGDLDGSGDSENADKIRTVVEQETEKANRLAELSSEETVFGMPVDYLREFEKMDAIALHLSDGLPVLILQGEKDRQVTMTDFALWRDGLTDHPNARFISYSALNHLFGAYTGDPVPFSQIVSVEYAQRTPVSQEVMNDISGWLTEQVR